MARTCCLKFKADGSLAARLCVDAGTSCPEGWTSASVADCKDCPPYPVGPTATGSTSDGATIQTADDQRFKEWQECRATIARFDTILEDLRKTGFSIITGLISAGALLSFLGVVTASGVSAPPIVVRASVFMVVMVLIAALFTVDTYYEVLLSGAVERALDLESITDPGIRLTGYLSRSVTASGSILGIKGAYLALLGGAYVLGRVMFATTVPGDTTGLTGLYDWVGGVLAIYIVVYFAFVAVRERLYHTKPRTNVASS